MAENERLFLAISKTKLLILTSLESINLMFGGRERGTSVGNRSGNQIHGTEI